MAYLGTRPSNQTPTYRQVYEFTATANQTTFSVPYTVGFVSVFRNGVQLGSANFTATNGTSVVLTSGCNAGDYVRIESLFTANVQGAIPNTTGAVATANIADGAITTEKIANGAVITADLADGVVTQAKLGTGVANTGPAFGAYLSSNQTIGGMTWTKMQCDTEEFDTNSNYNTTNYRFTPTVAGYYQISAAMNCSPANNFAVVGIFKNGSISKQGSNGGPGVNSSSVSAVVYLNGTSDYVEAYAVQGSGTTLQPSGVAYNYFNGVLVRAA